jgi:hypothetical protein
LAEQFAAAIILPFSLLRFFGGGVITGSCIGRRAGARKMGYDREEKEGILGCVCAVLCVLCVVARLGNLSSTIRRGGGVCTICDEWYGMD